MADALSELREAEATILRMRDERKYEVVNGWLAEPLDHPTGDGITEPVETHAPLTNDEGQVLSWQVLVEVVLPIIQDSIRSWETDSTDWQNESHSRHALRLARFVNERSK